MYNTKFYDCIARMRVKCSQCNREFDLSPGDLKKTDDVNVHFSFECPRCCTKNYILYSDLSVSMRDTL